MLPTLYTTADQANDALQTSANRAEALYILSTLTPAMLAAVADLNYTEETNRSRMVRALADAVHAA